MSSAYCAAPVALPIPSLRATLVPTAAIRSSALAGWAAKMVRRTGASKSRPLYLAAPLAARRARFRTRDLAMRHAARRLLAPAIVLLAATALDAQPTTGALDALTVPRATRLAHYSSRDTTGGNADFRRIAPGETLTLLDHRGAGVVRRWWITIAPRNHPAIQRQLVVRCWWDDEPEPSVEVPVSDFFGVGFGEWRQFTSLPLNMTSGGYNAYWAMPFRRRARITVENRSAVTVDAFYYNVAIETRDRLADSTLYFHAQFRRVTTSAARR